MQFKIIVQDKDVVYRAVSREGLSDEQLAGMFYTLAGDYYEKRLPLSAMMFEHDFPKIEERYNAFIKETISRKGTLEDLEKALLWIITEHEKHNIKWWLAGSAALFVRGLNVLPHDIDIMTYKSEISKIHSVVEPYIVEPFHHVSGWVVKGFGVINQGYRVDYAFEPEDWVDSQGYVDFGPYAEKNLEKVEWKGHSINVPPLKLHILSNKLRNRMHIAREIEKYI